MFEPERAMGDSIVECGACRLATDVPESEADRLQHCRTCGPLCVLCADGHPPDCSGDPEPRKLPSLPDLAPGQAVAVDWTAEQYHADRECVSRSQLETLRRSPQLYHALYEARTMQPESPTPAMVLGTYVHLAVLEPEEWRRRLYPPEPVRPEEADGRAKKDSPAKQAYLEWRSACEDWKRGIKRDSIVLSASEIENVEAIAGAIRNHPFAAKLFKPKGVNEQTILWREPTSGLLVRVRVDRLVRIGRLAVVLDLKTTSDERPDLFAASCARYGYHRQAAIYLDAVQALVGPDVEADYVLGVVHSSGAYEDCVYQIEPKAIEKGRAQYRSALADLVRRRAENDWRAAYQKTCQLLTLPRWAYLED